MLKSLLAVLGILRAAWLIELVGAALIIYGIYEGYGRAPAVIAGGVALVLKAFELDARGDG